MSKQASSSPLILRMASLLIQKPNHILFYLMSNPASSTFLKLAAFLIEKLSVFPSTSSLLSFYASFSTSLMLVRNVYHELVPPKLEEFIKERLKAYFSTPEKILPSSDTFIIDNSWGGLSGNKLIEITRLYLSTKIGPENKVIRVGKFSGHKDLTAGLVKGQEIIDSFQGIDIKWRFDEKPRSEGGNEYFQLTFESKNREIVFNEYLKHVISTYKAMTKNNEERVLLLYSLSYHGSWRSIPFQHSATFDTIAMDSDLKKSIMEDMDRYLTRKDYYNRIGKAWKRGYLLYGPPGTGKSSLIAAMANYLKYDIYNMELSDIGSDYKLRSTLLEVDRKSIIVVEDIDCNSEVHDRSKSDDSDSDYSSDSEDELSFSLSSLLNCVDGLWSSSLEERIIVFTTNRKEVLDPALLRPGRMDMHIHMSYCTPEGFRVLVSNYLEIKDHPLLEEIDKLIQSVEATPASLAEELMKSDNPDVALAQVVKFLNQKKIEKAAQDEELESLT